MEHGVIHNTGLSYAALPLHTP